MRKDAIAAINAAEDAFERISDPELALDLATILLASVLRGAPPEARAEVAKHLFVQSMLLLEHINQ